MTKTLLSAALIAGLGIAAFASHAAAAPDGTITISGQVTSATCTISVNGGTASPTVKLPTVQATDFTASGVATGYTAINIVLSGCSAGTGTPGVTTVLPYFEQGPSTDMSSGYLKNMAVATPATGVQVMLSTSNTVASAISLQKGKGAQNAGTAALLTGNPTFTYYASYVSNAATVMPGSVSTSVQYDLDYN